MLAVMMSDRQGCRDSTQPTSVRKADGAVKGKEAAAREGALPDTSDRLPEISRGAERSDQLAYAKNDPTPFTAETLRHEVQLLKGALGVAGLRILGLAD